MKRVAIGLGIAAIALAVTVVAALAASRSGGDGEAVMLLKANAATSTKPYIGVVIADLSAEKAQELQIAGGVEIREVMEGSPADGKLQVGDVVTAVNGDAVTTGELFRQKVLASKPGDSLRLSVLRSGSVVQVDVTVGETKVVTKLLKRGVHGLPGDLAGLLGDPNKLVRAEIVVEGENGYETITAVAGTIVSVDVAGGKLTLKPKNGSAQVSYQLGEDAVILSEGELGAENRAMVVAKDGVASLVVQGDFLDRAVAPFEGPFMEKRRIGRHGLEFPRIQRGLRMLPDGPMDRDVRIEIEKFLGDHPMPDEFEFPKDIGDGCTEERSDGRIIVRCIETRVEAPEGTQ
jgi:hypothetical protein